MNNGLKYPHGLNRGLKLSDDPKKKITVDQSPVGGLLGTPNQSRRVVSF